MWRAAALALCAAHLALCGASCDKALPDTTFMLNGANLEWPCPSTRSIYVSSGRYVPKNVIATRLQIYKDEAFVLMPRYKPGVPFTLGKTSLRGKSCLASLAPFPCWSLQEEGNCEALQSAVDLFLDPNDVLWVLDAGVVNTLEQPVRRCPPKVVAFCAKTGKVLKVLDLSALVTTASRLQYLVVDYAPDGSIHVYVSDAATRALLVWDVAAGRGRRVLLPRAVTESCTRRDVLYLALVRRPCGTTLLYLTYLSGCRVFYVKTSQLRRGARPAVVDAGRKPGPLVLLGSDGGQALFFRARGEGDVYMWSTDTPLRADSFLLVQKGSECRLATQVAPGYKRLMWLLESNFQDFIAGTVGCAGASVALHPLVKTCD
ncbi:major royal jelly protein 1 [Bacillus rossius redtenbacheri]|uniref:major royal jelly protein 1 n=1 Tax=Bacillus rossius redtenbacheri TaxID=93214 RepID=UPI002FDD34C2